MNDGRPSRFQRALSDTRSLRDSRWNLFLVTVGGAAAVLALIILGSDEWQTELITVAATCVALAAVVPGLELSWHYLWAPLRQLQEDVADLGARVREREPDPAREAASDPVQTRAVLVTLRDDLQHALRLIRGAHQSGRFWKMTQPGLRDRNWHKHRDLLSRRPGFQNVFSKLSEAFGHIDRLAGARALRAFSGSQVRPEDQLVEAIRSLELAESALDAEIGTLDREAAATAARS